MVHGKRLCVITGGEPFRQNISDLIARLSAEGITCQVETNGMLQPQGDAWQRAFIVISPKTHKLNPDLAAQATAFKYVLVAGDLADDGLPKSALGHPLPTGALLARPPKDFAGMVYIQPADEKNPYKNNANLYAAIDAVMAHPSYVLGVQLHKVIGVE